VPASIYVNRPLRFRVGRQFSLASLFVVTAVVAIILALVPRERLVQIAAFGLPLTVPGACLIALIHWKRWRLLAVSSGVAYLDVVLVWGYRSSPGKYTPWYWAAHVDWRDAVSNVWKWPEVKADWAIPAALVIGLALFALALHRGRAFLYLHLWLATLTLLWATIRLVAILEFDNFVLQSLEPAYLAPPAAERAGCTELASRFLFGIVAVLINVGFGLVELLVKDPSDVRSS
jgi:hypothetical protein